MGRGPTAYFLFAEEQREAVKADILARYGKAGVAAAAKGIGALWGKLSDEEKQVYKERAQQKALELKEQEAATQGGAGSSEQQDAAAVQEAAAQHEPQAGGSAPPPFGLPTSLVKKIITMDPDVQRISADGVRSIAKATDLFLQLLAAKSLREAAQHKRKNMQFKDMEAVAARDRRMKEMGLPEFFASDACFSENHERAGEENQSRKGNKKQAEDVKGMRPMTAFFAAAP